MIFGHHRLEMLYPGPAKTVGLVFHRIRLISSRGQKRRYLRRSRSGLDKFWSAEREMIQRVNEVLELLDISAYGDGNSFDVWW